VKFIIYSSDIDKEGARINKNSRMILKGDVLFPFQQWTPAKRSDEVLHDFHTDNINFLAENIDVENWNDWWEIRDILILLFCFWSWNDNLFH
jgi:hypothetical protein